MSRIILWIWLNSYRICRIRISFWNPNELFDSAFIFLLQISEKYLDWTVSGFELEILTAILHFLTRAWSSAQSSAQSERTMEMRNVCVRISAAIKASSWSWTEWASLSFQEWVRLISNTRKRIYFILILLLSSEIRTVCSVLSQSNVRAFSTQSSHEKKDRACKETTCRESQKNYRSRSAERPRTRSPSSQDVCVLQPQSEWDLLVSNVRRSRPVIFSCLMQKFEIL